MFVEENRQGSFGSQRADASGDVAGQDLRFGPVHHLGVFPAGRSRQSFQIQSAVCGYHRDDRAVGVAPFGVQSAHDSDQGLIDPGGFDAQFLCRVQGESTRGVRIGVVFNQFVFDLVVLQNLQRRGGAGSSFLWHSFTLFVSGVLSEISVSLCPCVPVSLCPCVPVSLCLSVLCAKGLLGLGQLRSQVGGVIFRNPQFHTDFLQVQDLVVFRVIRNEYVGRAYLFGG